MKKMLLTTLLTLGALLALLTVSASAAADTTFTQGDWEYTLSSGTISVSKYTGSASSVTIPSSVIYNGQTYTIRTVGASCFEDNTKLQSVTIPAQITSLGRSAFKNCTFLSSITINGNLADCSDGSASSSYDANYSSLWNTGGSVFYNTGTNVDSFTVTFGSGVTRIPAYLFATGHDESSDVYAHITSITIPSTVTEIGEYAFYRCYDLTDAPIGNGVTSIENNAFEQCTSLNNVTIGTNVNSIGANAFQNCTALTSIVIPASVTSLGRSAFKNCTFLSSITINGNLADCSDGSASSSYDANYSSLWNTGGSVFYNTGTNVDSFTVTFGSGVTRIPAYLFATGHDESSDVYAHITSITIPSTVTEIGEYAFYRCYDLTDAPIGNSVTSIENNAFEQCTSLSNVTIGTNVNSIGANAFQNCTALTSIVIPASVTSLGNCAFKNCTYLSSVTINGDLADCDSYSTYENRDVNYSVFYNTGTNADSFTVTFGSGVSRIPAYLFATGGEKSENIYCHVDTVYIRNATTEIGKSAFYNCYDLTSIHYQGTQSMWNNISGLEDSAIGDGVSIVYENVSFKDVRDNSVYYYTPVYWAYDEGITAGTTATTFSPSQGCTRGQFVTFLWNLAGRPEPENTTNSFSDVSSADYFCTAVLWAAENGVTAGTSATTFTPNRIITRAEAVAMLYRYAGSPSVSTTNPFTDVSSSAYYYNAVMWAVKQGITSGTSATTFSSSATCTRAMMVTFLYSYSCAE